MGIIEDFEISSEVGIAFLEKDASDILTRRIFNNPKPTYNDEWKLDFRNNILFSKKYEEVNSYRREYIIANSEEKIAYLKQYRKQYYLANQEDRIAVVKQYRAERRDEYNKVCMCKCGRTYTFQNKHRHEKTSLHRKGMQ